MLWFCLAWLLEAASKTRTALSAIEFYALLFFFWTFIQAALQEILNLLTSFCTAFSRTAANCGRTIRTYNWSQAKDKGPEQQSTIG
jgi:hypothetical protein